MRYRLEDEPRSARPSRARSETDVQFELGPRSILIFMGCLAVLCGLFYALGYTVGRHAAPLLAATPAQTTPAMAQPISHASAPGFTATLPLSANPSDQIGSSKAQPPNAANLSQAEQGQVPNSTSPAPVYAAAANSNALGDSSLALPMQSQPASGPSANPPQPNTVAAAAAAGKKKYAVQVFAGLRNSDALSLAAALKARQYPVFMIAPGPGNPYYKVQIGPYSQLQQAQAMRARLMAAGYHAVIK